MPFKIVFKHTVDDQPLAFIDRLLIDFLPKQCLEENIPYDHLYQPGL